MTRLWTRRQVLAQAGIAAAAVYTLDPHELCCGVNAYAQTASEEKFALKKVGDGIWAAVAEVRYKVKAIEGITEAWVEIVWEPQWDKERMSEAAKLSLGFF